MTGKPSQTLDYADGAHSSKHEPPTFFDRNTFPAHQFEDAAQQKEAVTLGMWTFLATEVLLFGGLFLVFTVYRNAYLKVFIESSEKLNVKLGTINTAVLLGSSLSVALAIHAAQTGRSRNIVRYLALTIVLGITFLCIKAVEYTADYHEGLIPWIGWSDEHPRQMKLFFFLYFVMTGLHAFHMIAGMLVLSVIAYLAHKGKFNAQYYNPVEMAGLYWHFIDIVWVFLLPTLYLLKH